MLGLIAKSYVGFLLARAVETEQDLRREARRSFLLVSVVVVVKFLAHDWGGYASCHSFVNPVGPSLLDEGYTRDP